MLTIYKYIYNRGYLNDISMRLAADLYINN